MNQNKILLTIFGVFAILIIILFSIFMIESGKRGFKQGSLEEKEIVQQISKYMLLPTDEEPTIGTISNIQDLKNDNPALYRDARDGDRIIVYKEKAIIYREVTDMIINSTIISRSSNNNTTPSDSN